MRYIAEFESEYATLFDKADPKLYIELTDDSKNKIMAAQKKLLNKEIKTEVRLVHQRFVETKLLTAFYIEGTFSKDDFGNRNISYSEEDASTRVAKGWITKASD